MADKTADPNASRDDTDKEGKRPLQARLIFVSHSHADRQLAAALNELIDGAFSGMVKPFVSSDPGPTGGLMPGDEWYDRIGSALRQAESVWVLATPTAVTRPWIYWEAGIGRALCPYGIVVLRVGLKQNEVPSPLSVFQSYDGLAEDSVSSLVGKVAAQIGMKVPDVLIKDCVTIWMEKAAAHNPEAQSGDEGPQILPERLDRLDAAIARVEALATPVAATRSAGRRRREPTQPHTFAGPWSFITPARLFEFLEAGDTTVVNVGELDSDADISIILHRSGEQEHYYLSTPNRREFSDISPKSEEAKLALAQILEALGGE